MERFYEILEEMMAEYNCEWWEIIYTELCEELETRCNGSLEFEIWLDEIAMEL